MTKPPSDPAGLGEWEPYPFFPERPDEQLAEGREPHAFLKADAMGDRFPTERQVGLLLFALALAMYLGTLSWAPFPGLPTRELLEHLEARPVPRTLDPLWGWLVRGCAHLPGLSVAAWTALFSAVCGAASCGLLGRLMVRSGYLIRNEPGEFSFLREAQARRISGLVAGAFLAVCIPFWMASTRSLPGAFHVLLLLVTAWFFSQYQHWGRRRDLGALAFGFGLGLAEFATFIVFAPLAVFLLVREMFRWRALLDWRRQAVLWAGFLLGAALYPLHALVLYRTGAAAGLYGSVWAALAAILRDQALLITQVRYSPGFPVIMFFSLVPWLTLFVMSRRSPWFYEPPQVIVRLIFTGGLLGVLCNASFAPWHLLGTTYFMVTPYLLLAVCLGYIAGEFWILGEAQPLLDLTRFHRLGRRAASALAVLLPAAMVAGGGLNWGVVDGRHGGAFRTAAAEILDRLAGRDILFSAGFLDESVRLEAGLRRSPVRVISAPRVNGPAYLAQLADRFPEAELGGPLRKGDFGAFLDTLMLSENGPARIGIIDMPDVFREYGYLVPDGLLYRLETEADRVDLAALVAAQRPFWERMERMARQPSPERNLARPYQDLLRLLASKVANNLGVMQAERGDPEGALETFRTARRIYPENLSVLLNLLELGRAAELPEAVELDAQWNQLQEELGGERWVLAQRYGYVWRAREWVRRGQVWALSGAPATQEGARRHPVAAAEEDSRTAGFLEQAYLLTGIGFRDETECRGLLMRDPRDASALLDMCRLALHRLDPEAAEAYLKEALAVGLSEDSVRFDRLMLAHVRGNAADTRSALEALVRQTPGDARAWMALALLGDVGTPENDLALKVLRDLPTGGLGLRLSLASLFMARAQWAAARKELEDAIQIDSQNAAAWEMLANVAQNEGNPKLMESSLRALLARNPDHYLQFQLAGTARYQEGDLAGAEAAFRNGLLRRRDPILLNNLASVVLERGGDRSEALDLMNEALRRQPGHGGLLQTRGEVLLALERPDEAIRDFQAGLKQQPRDYGLWLLLARGYLASGDRGRAATVIQVLAARTNDMPAADREKWSGLQRELGLAPVPEAP